MTNKPAPDAAMMSPPNAIARFIATGDRALLAGVFAGGEVTILENFAPFLFVGAEAVERWTLAMSAHAAGLTGLAHAFGPAIDFTEAEGRVCFSLPTRWRGQSGGAAFTETGGWTFVLESEAEAWRVRAYGWAVTGFASGGT